MNEVKYKKLSEIVQPPISGNRPSGGVNTETEGVPSLGGENILTSGGITYEVIKRISLNFYNSMPKGRLKKFDVLINKDGAQTGKVGLYKEQFSQAAVNEHLFIIRPKEETLLDPIYLYYSILLSETQQKIERRITGSAQPGLNSQFVKSVDIPFPGFKNQQKIVSILDTIDQVIEKTEALIKKYQHIKAGLMHDLFTRGIAADGKPRLPREQAPELYQETPIGWIPKGWSMRELAELSDICSGVTLGSKNTPDQTISVPYLRVANVQDGYLDLSDVKEILVSKKTFENLLLQVGDVLMNEGGDFDKLGRGAVWQGEIDPCIHQNHVFRVRTNDQKLRHSFLAYWSQSAYGKKYFVLSSKQSTNLASINSTQLKKFPVALPSLHEQEEIEKRVYAINGKITSLNCEYTKLTQQKSGLMHDLLTGKVQVSIDDTKDKVSA